MKNLTIRATVLVLALVFLFPPFPAESAATVRPITIGTLGGLTSQAVAINDRGQVIGNSQTADGEMHAFLWESGVMTDLGTEGQISTATDINENGQVIGIIQGLLHAFLWENGVLTDLGTLGGTSCIPHRY